MIPWLHSADDPLPDTRLALPAGSEAPGLLAAGGELTPQRLTEAYSKGVFPWYSAGQPVLWWSPDPRMVLPVAEFTAIVMLTPVMVTLLAAWLLKERVSRWRWALVAGGFVGVLIVIRPGSGLFGWAVLLDAQRLQQIGQELRVLARE